ncbi:hypothetical protein GQ42DRAFT_153217 [Ramicandelaber brevisporus]|nr:hypothetical protein GQ42DRAFT_153217 [Ramicandelaber brevisporus]
MSGWEAWIAPLFTNAQGAPLNIIHQAGIFGLDQGAKYVSSAPEFGLASTDEFNTLKDALANPHAYVGRGLYIGGKKFLKVGLDVADGMAGTFIYPKADPEDPASAQPASGEVKPVGVVIFKSNTTMVIATYLEGASVQQAIGVVGGVVNHLLNAGF